MHVDQKVKKEELPFEESGGDEDVQPGVVQMEMDEPSMKTPAKRVRKSEGGEQKKRKSEGQPPSKEKKDVAVDKESRKRPHSSAAAPPAPSPSQAVSTPSTAYVIFNYHSVHSISMSNGKMRISYNWKDSKGRNRVHTKDVDEDDQPWINGFLEDQKEARSDFLKKLKDTKEELSVEKKEKVFLNKHSTEQAKLLAACAGRENALKSRCDDLEKAKEKLEDENDALKKELEDLKRQHRHYMPVPSEEDTGVFVSNAVEIAKIQLLEEATVLANRTTDATTQTPRDALPQPEEATPPAIDDDVVEVSDTYIIPLQMARPTPPNSPPIDADDVPKGAVELEDVTRAVRATVHELVNSCCLALDTTVEIFPAITDEATELCWRALDAENDAEVFRAGAHPLTGKDLGTLEYPNWLNDEVIMANLNLFVERSKKDASLPKIYSFNTLFYEKISVKDGFKNVKRWTRKTDIFSYEILLVPVFHRAAQHWGLVVVDVRAQTITYLDSLSSSGSLYVRAAEVVWMYLQAESMDKRKTVLVESEWKREQALNVPQQENDNDCGVFVICMADAVSRRAPMTFNQAEMDYRRWRMVAQLVNSDLNAH